MQEETVFVAVFQEDNDEQCHAEIQRLKFEISECEAKINAAKDLYHQSLVVNLKKIYYNGRLKKTVEGFSIL